MLKVVDGFILRQVADEYVAVPSGEAAQIFSGLIELNETGADIFHLLQRGMSKEALLTELRTLYDVPRTELEADVDELLDELRTLSILLEA